MIHSEPSATTTTPDTQPTLLPLRVWPAVLLLLAIWIFRSLPGWWEDGPAALWMSAAFGPALCGLLVLLWWLTFSLASRREKLLGLAGIVLPLGLTLVTMDVSMRGPGLLVLTLPLGLGLFALGCLLMAGRNTAFRIVTPILLVSLGFLHSALLRTPGMWGDFNPEFHWRWTETAEERLLAERAQSNPKTDSLPDAEAIAVSLQVQDWPAFRGPNRDAVQAGVVFARDWETQPPRQLWKIGVGPAWSSFVVSGQLLFTQEQRGKMECIVCYDANTGEEIWNHGIPVRFFESLGGLGPRATPALHEGHLVALGAEGDLVMLQASDGSLLWHQNLGKVTGRKVPMWGYSSSPLIAGDKVIVYAGAPNDQGTLAFHLDSGELAWAAPAGEQSYSSPHLAEIHGKQAVLMLTDQGLDILDPGTGEARLNYTWPHSGYRSLQPAILPGNRILLPTGLGSGTRLIEIQTADSALTAREVWTSLQLKPDYNDFVVHEDHLYGFDVGMFTCIRLKDGTRAWKGGRYGKGQVLLLKDSGLLLVATERGAVVLLEATPEDHRELAEIPMLEGKTWNHPVVVGDRLYHRNADHAVCYQLPVVATAVASK